MYGAIPNRTMRAHSVTVVDNVVWLFGGCDERESWKDVYCLDVGAFVLTLSCDGWSVDFFFFVRDDAMDTSRVFR